MGRGSALAAGPLHGGGIAQRLSIMSGDVLAIGESSLDPALQRLLLKGWAKAFADFDRLMLVIHKLLNAT